MIEVKIHDVRNHFVSLIYILKDIKNKIPKQNIKKNRTKKEALAKIEQKTIKMLDLSIDWSLTYLLFFTKHIKEPIEQLTNPTEQKQIKKSFKTVMKEMLFVYTETKNIKKFILHKMIKEENNDRKRLLKKIETINQETKRIYDELQQKNTTIIKNYACKNKKKQIIKKHKKKIMKQVIFN